MRISPAVVVACACAAAAALASEPAGAFEGRVVFPDGTPVPDAIVSVLGRAGTTRTGPGGLFTWTPDPPVPFRVLVVLPGGRFALPAIVDAMPPEGPLVVTASPLPAESVTVTADAAPHIESPPAAVALLGREDLEQRRPAWIADVLENVAGASRLGLVHDAVPSPRGLARGRTLLLIDGARVATERRAGPGAGFLDPFFLESVEVTRGPGTVAYGSDALGGVVHAVPRRTDPGSPSRLRTIGSMGAGMPERSAGAEFQRGFTEGGILLQGRWRRFDDDRPPEGRHDNAEEEDRGAHLRLDQEAGPALLSAGLQWDAARDVELPTSDLDVSRVSTPRDDSGRLTPSYRMDALPGGTLLGFHGFLGRSRTVTEQRRAASGSRPAGIFLTDVRARDFSLRATASRPARRGRFDAGVDLNGRAGLEAIGEDPGGRARPVEDARMIDAAIFGSGEAPLTTTLTLSGGARLDRIAARNRGGAVGDDDTLDGALSGFAALTAAPALGLTVTAQAARGFRSPTLSDRDFIGTSGRGFVTGNPGLAPERSLQLDLAVGRAGRSWRRALFLYDYRI
jgi:outer membrane receptor protein involved in Fe transport